MRRSLPAREGRKETGEICHGVGVGIRQRLLFMTDLSAITRGMIMAGGGDLISRRVNKQIYTHTHAPNILCTLFYSIL